MNEIIKRFSIEGHPTYCETYGSGHINRTCLVKTDANRQYILQQINNTIFKDVDALMANITAVTHHIAAKDSDPRHVLTLVPTTEGGSYFRDDEGRYFRMYNFIEDSICLDKAETANDFYQSAVAFGNFQNQLADFPAATLTETIPHFHDTPDRYAQLDAAVAADVKGRLAEVGPEIDFVMARREEAGSMVAMLSAGELPLRVTHNDTKLNNVMLDAATRTPLCVIDLDTVMPGLAANDFGDSIRFGASTALEDEKDLSKVSMSLELYEAYARGFLGACRNLTQNELDTLPLGAKLMTLECGVRFLTDYLAGDTYFRIARPEHNLDRCRTQFKLVASMEQQWGDMARVIREITAAR